MVQKELTKLSQWFWNGFLKWYDGGGENGITSKRNFEVKCFSPLKILTSPFIWRDSWSFFSFFFSSFVSWGLEGFDDIWGENHLIKNFFSNGFNILVVDAYSGMELCMPIWLNHDYGDGGVVNILAVDVNFGVEACTPIFLGEASKKKFIANHFQKNFKTQMNTSLNKAQHKQELLCG
jgi:hypothetical protein